MWSAEVKQRFLEFAPSAKLVDLLGSSEAGMARSVTAKGATSDTARFTLREKVFVVDEQYERVQPGETGRLAVPGFLPVGYYKDADKTAATFPVIDGVRCAIPGDFARLESDGGITLVGRGSVCINTGGEKVFTEEVEEVIKRADPVRDAIVVGIPDERLGESVAAVVELGPGAQMSAEEVVTHVKSALAGYKAPRTVLFTVVPRMDTGKPDYEEARRLLRSAAP